MMPELGSEVFVEDGRRAVYAGEIDGQQFVRILLSRDDEEFGVEEWPSDKLTPVSRVLTTAPEERYAPAIEAAKADLEALRNQISTARDNVRDLQQQERELTAAIAKFPELGTAIDFLEGRITHVAMSPSYGASKVFGLSEYLALKSDYGRDEGLRLLCLFGTDDRKVRRWHANRYYDGSGGWTEVVPFKSEADANAYLRAEFEAELTAWRSGETRHRAHDRSAGIPAEQWPDDWREYVAEIKAKNAAERVNKLREQISAIEAEAAA
jgi:hypothetical protein